jgi:hypothetical protein
MALDCDRDDSIRTVAAIVEGGEGVVGEVVSSIELFTAR